VETFSVRCLVRVVTLRWGFCLLQHGLPRELHNVLTAREGEGSTRLVTGWGYVLSQRLTAQIVLLPLDYVMRFAAKSHLAHSKVASHLLNKKTIMGGVRCPACSSTDNICPRQTLREGRTRYLDQTGLLRKLIWIGSLQKAVLHLSAAQAHTRVGRRSHHKCIS
jgi:hypothetical protein